MNIQKNQSINHNETARNLVLRAMFLSIVGLTMAIFTLQARATTVETTIFLDDPGFVNLGGRVSVFDAYSGRQIANGHTVRMNDGTQQFFFTYEGGPTVVVAVTRNGYYTTDRGSGELGMSIFADKRVNTMPYAAADVDGDATLTYLNANGNPVRNAFVSTIEWESFGNARRGKTNAQGQYFFKDPKDLAGSNFVAVEWKNAATGYLGDVKMTLIGAYVDNPPCTGAC